uniref:Uncharacterized protein n=1 Tax=Molossus molossus TaxID=27622 RepID=A0A7J8E397_MOLMO|nr:hypothetical protein HJG59_009059 [Molossus molossus]
MESSGKNVTLPAVFKAPIQPDIVNFVHTNLCKNNRQPSAVSEFGIHQTGAETWGTGRALARRRSLRWWSSSFWPGCFWTHALWGLHICTNRNLVPLAPQSEHNTVVICHLLCPGCLSFTGAGDI